MPIDLFEPRFEVDKLDSNFRFIIESTYYDSARGVINEVFNSWDGFDNHYISEFQTTGFNSRLWELYLVASFKSLGFEIKKCLEGRPDFLIEKNGVSVFVEAVSTNPNIERDDFIPTSFDMESTEVFFLKFRSTLLKKLKKKYWELPWVQKKPLVLAISPFHSSQALNVTDFEVKKYLYGVTIEKEIVDGKLVITENRTDFHTIGERRLSNFYDIPLSVNISGILYSNSGTMGKFSRIGYQKGYGDHIHNFFYSGSCHHPEENSLGIRQFMFAINRTNGMDFTDEWRFGLSLFHNHKALDPIGYNLFEEVTQIKFNYEEGLFTRYTNFHPYNAKNLRTAIV